MVVSVTVGVVLASLLFMRRMAEVSGMRLVDEHPFGLDRPLPARRPALRGGRARSSSAPRSRPWPPWPPTNKGVRVVILDLRSVPAMDVTGLVALESAFERLDRAQVFVVLAGVQPQPLRVMARAGWRGRHGKIAIYRSFERAIEQVRKAFE